MDRDRLWDFLVGFSRMIGDEAGEGRFSGEVMFANLLCGIG
jgi:hypothetical protein